MQSDDFLTITEAAKALDVSKDTIRRRIKAGEIKAEKRPSPYGEQYYLSPLELTGAFRNVDVVKIEQTMTPEELKNIFTQAMQETIGPLHSEINSLRNELVETKTKLSTEMHTNIAGIGSTVGEALQKQNEALKTEITVLHDSINAIETRQKDREATHYDLVDKRLNELTKEPQRGFWSKIFGK